MAAMTHEPCLPFPTVFGPWPHLRCRGPVGAGAPRDRGFPSTYLDSVAEMHRPAAFAAVDRHSDLGIARRMIDRRPKDEELGTELRYRQDAAIHMEVNPNVRGMCSGFWMRCVHDQST